MSDLLGQHQTKDTEVKAIPTGWRVVRLGEVSREVNERNSNLAQGREDVLSVNNRAGLVPSYRKLGSEFSRYKLLSSNQFAYNPMRLNVGSIALCRNGTAGIVSPDYIVFGCDEDQLDPNFS